MNKDVACVIPALEVNQYSPLGDLEPFGSVSLFEWKLMSLLEFIDPSQIYVTTPSEKISSLAKTYGVHVIKRDENLDFSQMVSQTLSAIPLPHVMWTNVSSPVITAKTMTAMLEKYFETRSTHDSLVSVITLQEYFFLDGKPIHFDITQHISRSDLPPIQRMTNSCMIFPKEIGLTYRKLFGITPYLFTIPILESVEIKDAHSLDITKDIILHYFEDSLKRS